MIGCYIEGDMMYVEIDTDICSYIVSDLIKEGQNKNDIEFRLWRRLAKRLIQMSKYNN